jgi:membrane-associated phospholipid phosphatase
LATRTSTLDRPTTATTGSAVRVTVAAGLALLVTYLAFVLTKAGQSVDAKAVSHLSDSLQAGGSVEAWLRDVTMAATAAALAGCVTVALLRRRVILAVLCVVLVAGANVTTQVLKHVIFQRPELGHGTTNSMPSGHTTVVTSLVLATVLVAPLAVRPIVSMIGAVLITVVGVGTVVAAWHRPSDVFAALAVCLAWGGVVAAILSMRHEPPPMRRAPRSHPVALITGLVLAAGVFVELGVRPHGRDFVIHAVIMCSLALAGALVVGLFTRLVDARTG